jgi:hypothetical protein
MYLSKTVQCILFISLTLPFAPTVFCQTNFQPGYIVQLNGDTLKGWIDYRNWESNPTSILFKENENDIDRQFKPKDIFNFEVANEIYQSAIIERVTNQQDDAFLQFNNKKLLIQTDTAFILTIIKGPKSFYAFQSKKGNPNFYIQTDSSYKLLLYKRYITKRSGLNVFEENKTYLGQLRYYFQDCPAIHSKINTTKYNKNEIEKLFLSYYKNCGKTAIEFQKKKDKIAIEFGIIAGASRTIVEFYGYGIQYLNLNNSSINPVAGIFLDIIRPRNQGKWSLNNEFIFTSFNTNSNYLNYVSDNEYSTVNLELAYSNIKMNNMVRFKYPVGKCYIYANAGISNGYTIFEKNSQKIVSKYYSTDKETNGKLIPETRKYEQGYIVGFGARYKKYSLEIRIERSNGMTDYSELSTAITKNYVLIGYRF